jgi:hypothetical protein
MTADEAMCRIEALLAHVWMVRAFLKHSDEAAEDAELQEVHRGLYDYQLALGAAWDARQAHEYLHLAGKKFGRLREASETLARIQPEVSTHTNFQMAVRSLSTAVREIGQVLEAAGR